MKQCLGLPAPLCPPLPCTALGRGWLYETGDQGTRDIRTPKPTPPISTPCTQPAGVDTRAGSSAAPLPGDSGHPSQAPLPITSLASQPAGMAGAHSATSAPALPSAGPRALLGRRPPSRPQPRMTLGRGCPARGALLGLTASAVFAAGASPRVCAVGKINPAPSPWPPAPHPCTQRSRLRLVPSLLTPGGTLPADLHPPCPSG